MSFAMFHHLLRGPASESAVRSKPAIPKGLWYTIGAIAALAFAFIALALVATRRHRGTPVWEESSLLVEAVPYLLFVFMPLGVSVVLAARGYRLSTGSARVIGAVGLLAALGLCGFLLWILVAA